MSASGIELIVGLGNPGEEYEHTRHNAGAWFVERLAEEANVTLRQAPKFHALHAFCQLKDKNCHLVIPTTYMNLSGRAVGVISRFYKIPPESILIAHDELDLPIGESRLKFDGGTGGHNGLEDIIQQLQSRYFYRLRIGIGHPGKSKDVSNYVLKPPGKAERLQINDALQSATKVLPLLLDGHFQKAMHQLHTRAC